MHASIDGASIDFFEEESINRAESKMSMLLGFNRGGGNNNINNNNNGNNQSNKHVAQAPNPDVLMQKMDHSIATVELRRATAQLAKYPPPSPSPSHNSSNGNSMRAKDESVLLANNKS